MPNSFEVFGFDLLIDATWKPWLLEVRHSCRNAWRVVNVAAALLLPGE